jgi:hypothetical protein
MARITRRKALGASAALAMGAAAMGASEPEKVDAGPAKKPSHVRELL